MRRPVLLATIVAGLTLGAVADPSWPIRFMNGLERSESQSNRGGDRWCPPVKITGVEPGTDEQSTQTAWIIRMVSTSRRCIRAIEFTLEVAHRLHSGRPGVVLVYGDRSRLRENSLNQTKGTGGKPALKPGASAELLVSNDDWARVKIDGNKPELYVRSIWYCSPRDPQADDCDPIDSEGQASPGELESEEPNSAGDGSEPADVFRAFRGHSELKLSRQDYYALDDQLEVERRALLAHPEFSRQAIETELSKDRTDSFLTIELAGLLLVLDQGPDALSLATSALLGADLPVHPKAAARAIVRLGAQRCASCLPAVMRGLELWAPLVRLPETGLDLESGGHVRASLGPYGDAVIPTVIAALDSGDCMVRGNAALALMFLRPNEAPKRLREIACTRCQGSEVEIWNALGELDGPRAPILARPCLRAIPRPDAFLRRAIVGGLANDFVPGAIEVLDSLRTDPDPEVTHLLESVYPTLVSNVDWMADIRAAAGLRGSPAERVRLLEALELGDRTGHYIFDERIDTFASNITLEDLPLVNRVRAGLMAQLTPEANTDYAQLTHAVQVIQLLHQTERARSADAAVSPDESVSGPVVKPHER